MEFTIPKFVAYCSAWFGIIAGIWALFERAETVIRPEIKNKLIGWLKNDRDTTSSNWPEVFTNVFDRFFGRKHFTFKCFWRSSIASISVVLLMALILYSKYGSSFWDDTYLAQDGIGSGILYFLIITLIINLIPDYFSLLETRRILNWMTKASATGKIALLFADLVATTIILSFAIILGATTLSLIVGEIEFGEIISELTWMVEEIPITLTEALTFWVEDDGNAIAAMWVYSTYFTSVWIWFFYISSLLVKIAFWGIKNLKKAKFLFDIEAKPIRTLGFISMLLTTIAFILIPFF